MFRKLPTTRPQTAPTSPMTPPYGHEAQVTANIVVQAEGYARAWQYGCAVLLGVVLIEGICLTYKSITATVTTYVVEVDTLGTVRKVQPPEIPYVPTDAAMAKVVTDFIKVTRGLTTDGKLLHDQWDWAFAVCTQRAAQLLNTYAGERAFNTKLGKEAISIQITRVLRATDTSWDVAWQETRVDKNGNRLADAGALTTGVEMWSGLFTIALRPPKNETELRVSPLGIWVDSYSWSRS